MHKLYIHKVMHLIRNESCLWAHPKDPEQLNHQDEEDDWDGNKGKYFRIGIPRPRLGKLVEGINCWNK